MFHCTFRRGGYQPPEKKRLDRKVKPFCYCETTRLSFLLSILKVSVGFVDYLEIGEGVVVFGNDLNITPGFFISFSYTLITWCMS